MSDPSNSEVHPDDAGTARQPRDARRASVGADAVRFAPLPCELADLLHRRELVCNTFVAFVWLTLQAKLRGDTGAVWASATTLSDGVPGLSLDDAKRALRELQRRGFVLSFRQRGSRGSYPLVLDRYLLHGADGETRRVSAAATTDWRHPASEVCATKRTPRAPRTAPPCIEPEPRTEPERPSDASEIAPAADCVKPFGRGTAAGGLTPEGLADVWATSCASLSQPARPLAKGVRAALAAALRRDDQREWLATFQRVAASAFLSGQRTDFRASLLWVIAPKNIAKLDAGQYDDAPAGRAGQSVADRRQAERDRAVREAAHKTAHLFADGQPAPEGSTHV